MDSVIKLGILGFPLLIFAILTIVTDSLLGLGLIAYMLVLVILVNHGVLDEELKEIRS